MIGKGIQRDPSEMSRFGRGLLEYGSKMVLTWAHRRWRNELLDSMVSIAYGTISNRSLPKKPLQDPICAFQSLRLDHPFEQRRLYDGTCGRRG